MFTSSSLKRLDQFGFISYIKEENFLLDSDISKLWVSTKNIKLQNSKINLTIENDRGEKIADIGMVLKMYVPVLENHKSKTFYIKVKTEVSDISDLLVNEFSIETE